MTVPARLHLQSQPGFARAAAHALQPRPARILLSPPHMSGREKILVGQAFAANWIAPIGPQLEAFQHQFEQTIGAGNASLAVSSGTAAIHLALQLFGVQAGDTVFVSTLTFAGSVFPIRYVGATPVFIGSERQSWNMDPALLEEALSDAASRGALPKAVIVVHLYGQSADMDPILRACRKYGVPVIGDAAEALGATYKEKSCGTWSDAGIFSFNGNKIITTSGGGMLVSKNRAFIDRALKLSTQAREKTPHYEHTEIGYNYRMSNIAAAIGLAQLEVLSERVAARRRNFAHYESALQDVPGISFTPEAAWGRPTRWLTTLTVDPVAFGCDRDAIIARLEAANIESRPVWKPMHMQPVFAGLKIYGGSVSEEIFREGLCLPSGSSLTEEELNRVTETLVDARNQNAGSVD